MMEVAIWNIKLLIQQILQKMKKESCEKVLFESAGDEEDEREDITV